MTSPIANQIQLALGLSTLQFARLVERAPYTYKIYQIPKRTGGTRTIAQPAKETKLVQHWLIENVFSRLPMHDAATAYRPGGSIKLNASRHTANPYFSKFDFKNFFPSIRDVDIVKHISLHFGDSLSQAEIAWIARISCIKLPHTNGLCLSVGAPSSPILSNSVMFEFDKNLDSWCSERSIVYTRYADDLTFSSSTKHAGAGIEVEIRRQLGTVSFPKLSINDLKTVHVSKKHQRRVTGLIITNEGNLSLGRERKRHISVLIHKLSTGNLPESEAYWLQGILGFAKNVEPNFVASMAQKYGSDLITAILRLRKPSA